MKLSVVIVNYNVKYYLAQCLHSLERALAGIEAEAFVVDNHSTDGSIPFLKSLFPWARFVENSENLGFAKANNQAISESAGEYVLLLNPDTFVGEQTIKSTLAFMDGRKDVGACGVQMLNADGSFAKESRRGVPTPFTSFCKMSGLSRLFPNSRTFGRYHMLYLDSTKASQIEIISGACMFIRKSLLDKTGAFDESFFMYGEDIDLSYRLMQAGMKNYYLPVRILHYKGESTRKNSFRYVYVFYQAMLIFFKKHYGHLSVFYSLPVKAAIVSKAVCTYLIEKAKGTSKKSASPLEYVEKMSFLLVGDSVGLGRMENIARKHGLSYNTLVANEGSAASEKGHLAMETGGCKFDFVVYDVDTFTYDRILSIMSESSCTGSRPLLATYSSRLDCIITSAAILQ